MVLGVVTTAHGLLKFGVVACGSHLPLLGDWDRGDFRMQRREGDVKEEQGGVTASWEEGSCDCFVLYNGMGVKCMR